MKISLIAAPVFCLLVGGSLMADTITPRPSEIDGTMTGGSTAVNLLTQGQSSFGSLAQSNFTPWNGGSSDVNALNDNGLGAYSLSIPNSSWTLIAKLNTTVNTAGYDITDIKTISGWNADFVDQNYQLSYSKAGTPDTYIPLGTYAVNNPFNSDPGGHQTTLQLDLAGTSGGVIASNVANLKFDFSAANASSNWHNATAYREVEAFGTAATPEPSSIALCGVALLAAARRRRNA